MKLRNPLELLRAAARARKPAELETVVIKRSNLPSEDFIRLLGKHATPGLLAVHHIATRLHDGQKRNSGGPYLGRHSLPIAADVHRFFLKHPKLLGDYAHHEVVTVAIGHDCGEDAPFGFDVYGIISGVAGWRVSQGIQTVSRMPLESYPEFISRIAGTGTVEFVIKAFDVLHNLRDPGKDRFYLKSALRHSEVFLETAQGMTLSRPVRRLVGKIRSAREDLVKISNGARIEERGWRPR